MVPLVDIFPIEMILRYLKPWSIIHNNEARKGEEVKKKFMVVVKAKVTTGQVLCVTATRGENRGINERGKHVAVIKKGESRHFSQKTLFDCNNDLAMYELSDFVEWLGKGALKCKRGILEKKNIEKVRVALRSAAPRSPKKKKMIEQFKGM